MTEERQASLLAEWLERPGTPPPEGLDPDVIQSTLALRPEMAPAPSVSLDDILAGVSEGPFAGGAQSRSAELPLDAGAEGAMGRSAELPLDTATDLEPANTPEIQGTSEDTSNVIDLASRRRRRIWGGLGLLAAAALVLVTVGPSLDTFNAPPAEEAGVQALPGAADQMVTERGLSEDNPRGAGGAMDDKLRAPEPAKRSAAPEPEPAAPSDPEALPKQELAPVKPAASSLQKSQEEASYGPPPTTATSNDVLRSAPASSASSSWGGSYDTLDIGSRKEATAQEDADSERRFKLRSAKSDEADAPAVADDFAYEVEQAQAEPEGLPSDLDGLRSAAVPQDYRGGWYLTGLDGEAYDRFEAALNQAQGQSASAQAGIYAGLIGDADTRVGQDMAFRAAKAASQAGDDAAALSYLRQGQARSSLNTPQRANLYFLEGQIRERQGDLAGAQEAYRVAANMNQAR